MRKRFLEYGSMALSLIKWEAATASAQSLQRAAPDIQLSVTRYIVIGVIFIIFASFSDLLADIFLFSGVSILPLSYATGLFFSMRMIILTLLAKLYSNTNINMFTKIAVVGSVVDTSNAAMELFLQRIYTRNSARHYQSTLILLLWKVQGIISEIIIYTFSLHLDMELCCLPYYSAVFILLL